MRQGFRPATGTATFGPQGARPNFGPWRVHVLKFCKNSAGRLKSIHSFEGDRVIQSGHFVPLTSAALHSLIYAY